MTVEPRLAATILLIRDGLSGLEVFMVERHRQIDFATGALVFPGGKVDPADAVPVLRERCEGASDLDDDSLAVRVAGIRETFEEAGVLLARPRGGDALVSGKRLHEIAARYRTPLQNDQVAIVELVEREDLALACDLLVPFAHWITPEMSPKRYDTHFFLTVAPDDHAAEHDGAESVDSIWTSPPNALADAEAGRRTIVFATQMNLHKLGYSKSVDQALDTARREGIVTVLPRLETGTDGKTVLRIPTEAGYPLSEIPYDRIR